MELIRNFKKLNKNDALIAGGKGASLGEMTQVGIPVPHGFVILSTTFDKFIEATDLNVEIDSVLHSVNHKEIHIVENASEKIQALILAAQMPEDIAKEIKKYFSELDTKYVAVRSSATAEDSASAAWAGQLDSFLNTTEENLLENVKKCWASLFTPRAIFYRFEKELHKQKISVAVVVQKMVQSEISGIAFSVHPVTQDYNQLIIEAGLGLGEAIVSGQITPDSYVVEKQPRRIIDKNVSLQKRGLFRSEKGGNEWQDISEKDGEKQTLTDEQILELSEIILKIENHYGFPCDIEWAFACPEPSRREEGGNFYIVQSRPITTLNKLKDTATIYKKVYTRENSLIAIQIWEEQQCRLLKEKLGENVPTSIFDAHGGVVSVIYHKDIFDIWFELISKKADSDQSFIPNTMIWYGEHLDKLEKIWHQKKLSSAKELADFFSLAAWAWIGLSVSYCLPEMKNVSEESQKLGMFLRQRSIDFLESTDHIIQNTLRSLCPDLGDLVKYVMIEEVREGSIPSREILKERENHYIYFDFNLYTNKDICEITKENNIEIEEEKIPADSENLVGQTAMGGKVVGKVRILSKKAQIPTLQEGEVLVTAMTTPDFLPAMQKAAAFITDEGGVTCHAAIVARELEKPCIIGTKIATQVLKDGDMVEVDADNGIVKILK